MLEINTWIVAVCLAVPTIIIVVGGIKHIANACSVLVPWMVGIFMFCAMCILIRNGSFIIPAIKLICVSAFSFHAVGGGFVGAGVLMALKLGVTRGQSPIDAGLGASAIIASSTRTEDPVRQALVSSMSTFWDSVVACSITGLVIVTSIMKSPDKLAGLSGERLTHAVFNELPGIGGFFYPIILFLFFYTAILGWSLIGERSVEYLFGRKGVPTFRYFWILAVVFGSMLKSPDESDVPGFFLELSYLALGLMTVLNLVPTLFLHKVVVSETRKYLWDRIDDPQAYADPPDQQKIPQETEKKPNRASHSEEFGNHSH
jgi:AGCS family alanine or glycine:cation symporter